MNENEYLHQSQGATDEESFDFDELEKILEGQLSEHLQGMEDLEEETRKVEEPEELGNAVLNVVWEQLINQIGTVAGDEFIKANRNMKLDLRNEAHIQTTENFSKGKIATHNDKIDYQKRYEDWQEKFERDENGNIKTYTDRTGKQVEKLTKDARKPFDADRPKGSRDNHTDMDHTVSAAKIIRDPEANAHLSLDQQKAFANSKENLNEIDSGMNRSKKDLSMEEWLDTPNANGQKPNEIFDISEKDEQEFREKGKVASKEFEKRKDEGVKESVRVGRQSQREEAFRIGGKALQSMIFSLLTDLLRNIIGKLISWLKSAERNLKTFIESVKTAIIDFATNLQRNVLTAGNAIINTIATAIVGPVVDTIRKVWTVIKQGVRTLKEAIDYLRDPSNKGKSFSILMLQIGNIVVAGITAAGSVFLGEIIEKALMTIPGFAFPIPIIGSLASLIGIFLGACICGIAGALILNLLHNMIVNKRKEELIAQQILEGSAILDLQGKAKTLYQMKYQNEKKLIEDGISSRHEAADRIIRESTAQVFGTSHERSFGTNISKIDVMLNELDDPN